MDVISEMALLTVEFDSRRIMRMTWKDCGDMCDRYLHRLPGCLETLNQSPDCPSEL